MARGSENVCEQKSRVNLYRKYCMHPCCSVSSILIIDITNTYICLFLLLLTYCFQIFVNARLIIFCTIFDCRLILHSLSHLCINFINFLIYYNNNCWLIYNLKKKNFQYEIYMKKEKGKINFMLNKIEIVEFRTELYIYIYFYFRFAFSLFIIFSKASKPVLK